MFKPSTQSYFLKIKVNCSEAEAYAYLGFREFFKTKRFPFLIMMAIVFLAALVSFVATKLYEYGWHGISAWYFQLALIAISSVISVLLIQSVLCRYRTIANKGSSRTVCFIWAALYPAITFIISFSLNLMDKGLFYEAINPAHLFLFVETHRLIVDIIASIVMAWISFYPFLFFENSQSPFSDNYKLVKKCWIPLALVWFSVSFVGGELAQIIRRHSSQVLAEYASSIPPLYSGIFIFMRHFIVDAFLALIPPLAIASAYLRETGERSFIESSERTAEVATDQERIP